MKAVFDLMFVMSLVLPPAVVLVGAVVLAWPRHGREAPTPAAHPAHA